MRIRRPLNTSNFRAALLTALIGLGVLIESPSRSSAETILENGYFIGFYANQHFEAFFSADGALTIYSAAGEFEGHWDLMRNILCVEFESGPRVGQKCERIEKEGPFSLHVGEHLFLAKLASAMRLS